MPAPQPDANIRGSAHVFLALADTPRISHSKPFGVAVASCPAATVEVECVLEKIYHRAINFIFAHDHPHTITTIHYTIAGGSTARRLVKVVGDGGRAGVTTPPGNCR